MTAVLITGTPGTGKTTASKITAKIINCPLVVVNDLVNNKNLYDGYDPEKGYKVVDLEALSIIIETKLKDLNAEHLLIEGHLSHTFKNEDLVDTVIVLRTRPEILRKRLNKRGWSDSKVHENLEAEALDICTFEAVETHGDKVNELDTSDIDVDEVANILVEIIEGKKYFPPGNINFLEDLYG